jgi:hypothetical protein
MADPETAQAPVESAFELVGRPELLRGLTVHAGVALGIIDLLGGRARTTSDIASELDLLDEYAGRLLRALSVHGVLETARDGRYSLTPIGDRFRSDHPESIREYLLYFYNPKRFAAIRHLPAIVAKGGPTGYELEFDKSLFELFDDDPELSAQFNGMLDLASLGETERDLTALKAVDFSAFDTICDVAGGYGDLLSRLLERHPHLEGTVLELPSVLAKEGRLRAPIVGVEDRCDYVEGDMFEAVPDADAYILNQILHDWPDEDCLKVLSNIHDAAPTDGQLFVRERIISADDPEPAKIDMDIWMMLETGGQERTRAGFQGLLQRGGWEIEDILPVEGGFSFLKCAKV